MVRAHLLRFVDRYWALVQTSRVVLAVQDGYPGTISECSCYTVIMGSTTNSKLHRVLIDILQRSETFIKSSSVQDSLLLTYFTAPGCAQIAADADIGRADLIS